MTPREVETSPLLGGEELGDALARLIEAARPSAVVDGWATVELDRAEVELAATTLEEPGDVGDRACAAAATEAVPPERILGAACRLLHRPDGATVLLLEPSTEGRLAAALARHGEGFIARYLMVDAGASERVRRVGLAVTAMAPGPFGPERLVLAGPRDGPFVILAGLG